MSHDTLRIDSSSVGDPARFPRLDDLDRALAALSPPRDLGRVARIVRRVEPGGLRETLDRVRLAPDTGVPGDSWGRRPDPEPEAQIAVMQVDVATLVANGQPLELFGDSLFLDLDLSRDNLPAGSRVRLGGATLEVTPLPHDGCKAFLARFGQDALRFVSRPATRHRNLRGVYMRVVEAGDVSAGDVAAVLTRGPGG